MMIILINLSICFFLLIHDGLYSVDQLTDENMARSRLSFLKGVRPHERGCIVVSALQDGGG